MRAKLLATAATVLMVLLPMQTAYADDATSAAYNRHANVSVQERARPEYDPQGLRFGGFNLNASVGVTGEANDNVFADPSNTQSDVITQTAENVELASHWSRHSLSFAGGATQRTYQDNDSDNTDDDYLRADGRLDVLSHSDVGAGVATADLHEARTDPDSPTNVAEPVQYKQDTAYAYARHAFNRVRLTARYQEDQFDYEDTPLNGGGDLDQDFRDYKQTLATGRLELALTPRFALLAQGEANTRKYDDETLGRDSDGRVYTIGANFDVTDLIRGEVAVGRFDQNYDDPAIGDVKGTAYRAHVDWFPTQLTTVQFNAGRGVEESGTPGASFLHTYESVRVDHELLRNVILTGSLTGAKYQYRGINRTDDTVSAEAGAEYLMNRRVRLHIGYAFDRDHSTQAAQNFEVNRVFIGASFHL